MTIQDIAIARILSPAVEGGRQNDPHDSDGPLSTMCGVTAPTYAMYLGRAVTEADMRRLTPAIAADVYRWLFRTYGLTDTQLREHPPLCHHMYDAAVHCGPRIAIRFLQHSLARLTGRVLTPDGVLGPLTADALARLSLPQLEHLALLVYVARLEYLGADLSYHPAKVGFAKGWMQRMGDLLLFTEGVA